MYNRLFCLAVTALLLGGTVVTADEAKPAAAKPVIFVNTNLAQPKGIPLIDTNNMVASNGGYTDFLNVAKAMGYEVRHGLLTGITADFLETVDLLILPIPGYAILDDEKAALRDFIKQGGGLWILVFPPSSFKNLDLSNLDSLLADYGITFGPESSAGLDATVVDGSIFAGPLKATSLRSPYGQVALDVNVAKAAKAAVFTNGKTLAAYSTNTSMLGAGKVFVLGDFSIPYRRTSPSLVDVINAVDNKTFLSNVLTWFKGSFDLAALKVKVQGGPFAAGGTATVKVKVKNLGTSDSTATTIRLTLYSSDGTAPAEEIKILKNITLPVVTSGKAKTVKTSVVFPSFLSAGTYYIAAQIDPNGTSGDTDSGNNMKQSIVFTLN